MLTQPTSSYLGNVAGYFQERKNGHIMDTILRLSITLTILAQFSITLVALI